MWRKRLPDAELRSMTAVYNCMGMVFGCRRTSIDPEHLPTILREDSYVRVDSITVLKSEMSLCTRRTEK